MPAPLLQLIEVAKRYTASTNTNAVAVLDGVSLEVACGESLAIVGPSGSGKSTLLQIIGTLDRPTSGEVLLDGKNLATLDDLQLAAVRNRQIGFVFQSHYLLPQCTVMENVLVPTLASPSPDLRPPSPRPTGRGQEEGDSALANETRAARAARLLKRVGLGERLHHRPGQLSGGERQRVAVVRALVNQPQLLLADEPTGALDHASATALGQLLVELNREEGVTLIVVTHAMDLAKRMGRVLTLSDGRLAEAPVPTSKFQRSSNDQAPNNRRAPFIWCLEIGASLVLGAWHLELMTFRTLIRRNLRFHWRSHLGVVLGAAVGSAALIGALVVGDSVRESLREQALERLGRIYFAVLPSQRAFTENLPASIPNADGSGSNLFAGRSVGLLRVSGTISKTDGSSRANGVTVYGDPSESTEIPDHDDINFWTSAPGNQRREWVIPPGEVWLNTTLANQLQVIEGDAVIMRIEKSLGVSSDAMFSNRKGSIGVLRAHVGRVLTPNDFGELSLVQSGGTTLNAFVSLPTLQAAVGMVGRVNLIVSPCIYDYYGGKPAFTRNPLGLRLFHVLFRLSLLLKMPDLFAEKFTPSGTEQAVAIYSHQLESAFHLTDAECSISRPVSDFLQLASTRVFIDPPIVRAALAANTNAQPILTYLATLFRAGTNATPYSMVTAAGAPWAPVDLPDDEIIVSQWLADDLRVKPGDEIALSYFLPESGTKLEEATNTFRVRSIVPMEMPWADRTLMPDFPGIEKAESTSEWDAGFPLTYKVRPKDDDYWKQHRGTPKAFITLAAGQKMWGNRFGNLTAIRFPIPTNTTTALTPALTPGERENRSPSSEQFSSDISTNDSRINSSVGTSSPLPGGEGQGEGGRQTNFAENYRVALESKILANLKPEELGLRFEPVREQALKAAEQSQDFGGLFLGFSFFLIAAALLLMAMLFQLGLEQRAPEIGTLLALGFTPKQVRRLLLGEGVALAFVGGLLGAAVGLAYARAMLHGLTTIWRDAVGDSALSFHFTAQTLVIGLFASVVVSAVTIWLTLRKFVRRPPRELLAGEIPAEESKIQSLKSKVIGAGALVVALALVGWTLVKGDTANAGAFFGAGALVLVAGLSFASAWLSRMSGAQISDPKQRVDPQKLAGSETGAPVTLASLGLRGCARRRKRSLATVAMLACGSFLIVSIGVFRLDANRDASQRSSGTGGFALIGETTMPVVHDLNTQSGHGFFALNEGDLVGVKFVPFRVRDGDEASCLNLNAAQKPRLLGVKPEMLEGRFSFAKGTGWKVLSEDGRLKMEDGKGGQPPTAVSQSSILHPPPSPSEIPAIGDANSIQWAMHKKVGDTIDYVDERGQPFKVRIVGAVANSILQGQLIIDEAEFVKRFAGESGYRMFLMDAPSNTVSQVSSTLSRAMQDVGLELTPAAQRLAQFNAVQNTYLGTFQVLGGLGLLLGSVGLGIVVLRNVLERRGELAVLVAVGFRKASLQRLLLIENGALLALGLVLGIVAAAVAVLPALISPSGQLPYASLVLTLGAVLVNGALWTWVATRVALRGNLLAALRND